MDDYFDTHFASTSKIAHLNRIRKLWSSAINDITNTFARCDVNQSRKRRDWNPCTGWKNTQSGVDNVWKDTNLVVMHAGWFVRNKVLASFFVT